MRRNIAMALLVAIATGCAHVEPMTQDDWPDYREDRDSRATVDSLMDADFAKASAKSGR